ncbi:response regulator [Streptomyces abyssomicinicus]|uniref:response regulator n=1 Tax=Streptomyces abyssomicinicus TaxID=574929 RepID=UPI00124FE8C0|nr:response regulator [Streptomyces abyssomicinicus]
MPMHIPRPRAVPSVESDPAADLGAWTYGAPAEEAPRPQETAEAVTSAAPANPHAVPPAGDDALPEDPHHHGTRPDDPCRDDHVRQADPHHEEHPSPENPASSAPVAEKAPAPAQLTLLLIEADPGGSAVVSELLASDGRPVRVRTARNLTEAERLLTDDVNCILLDLDLPAPGRTAPSEDGAAEDELVVLKHVLRIAPRHAVLALTSSGDAERRGPEAVRVGAQDYLVRDELDGRLLRRAIRYAVERKRSDTAERRLTESRMRAQENARLERGLLPTPILDGSLLRFAARYRPGRSRALLGGDFYDTVRTPDGAVHVMIGDVAGHGPDEAALGVELRIAWRALTLAGLSGDDLLTTLQKVLEHERHSEETFATLCQVDIAPDGRSAGVCLAGHPPPLISRPGEGAHLLPYEENGPALGLLPDARWPRTEMWLGDAWSLMLYTDGLIEGRDGNGQGERLGEDGMADLVRHHLAAGLSGEPLLRETLAEVRSLNGGELTDDVAVLLLERG